jgi:hypothetical protein
MVSELYSDEGLTTIELDLDEEAQLIANILINEGRRREREEIVEALMRLDEAGCCCDSATFGDHYLSDKQPDNLISLINSRKIG